MCANALKPHPFPYTPSSRYDESKHNGSVNAILILINNTNGKKRKKKNYTKIKKKHNEKPKTFPYLGVKCTVTVMSNENGMQHT